MLSAVVCVTESGTFTSGLVVVKPGEYQRNPRICAPAKALWSRGVREFRKVADVDDWEVVMAHVTRSKRRHLCGTCDDLVGMSYRGLASQFLTFNRI